jgi:hypothetical protein
MKEHKITRQTIKAPGGIHTMSWLNDGIIDWAQGGMFYRLDGSTSQKGNYHYAFSLVRPGKCRGRKLY